MKINRRKLKKVYVVVIATMMFLCSCKFGNNNSSDVDSPDNEPSNVSEVDEKSVEDKPEITEPNGDIIDNQDEHNGDENTDEPSENTKDPKDEPSVEKSTPVKKPNGNSSQTGVKEVTIYNDPALISYWSMIETVAGAAQSYYTENFSKTRIITDDGYLYNKAAGQKIDIEYLVANGSVSNQYLNKGIEVLLLDCADFENFENFKLKNSETSLTVFASIKHPTENSYILTSSRSLGGVISASQYAALLNSYYQNHGTVGNLYPGTEDYDRILSFISMYESKYDSYYVRSVAVDNKYAMVVLSGQTNPADIKQYVLKKNGSIWEVVLSGLETDPRVVITVNKALPDFNLDMIPAYTINDHKGSLSKDKSDVINLMVAKGLMSNSSEIKYISGTSNYCYVVLNNEIKFICNNTGDDWNIVQVASPDEAHRKMLAISKTAPTFIVLDS